MKLATLLFCIILTIGQSACDFSGVLSSEQSNPEAARDNGDGLDAFLQVGVTGGFAGVEQSLAVASSGLATYADSFQPGAEWIAQLLPEELDNLKKLFTENGFMDLGDQYIDKQVADAFIYEIRFTQNGVTKTVVTDRFAAPENLKTIVDGITQWIARLTENGPKLDLTLSADHLKHGESVDMLLSVTNTKEETLTLNFSSGQIFDFKALSQNPGSDTPNLAWNWAHEKAFTLALWKLELQPGESKSYQVSWDGRDNAGEFLSGDFEIVARLVSIPGGTSVQRTLHISE